MSDNADNPYCRIRSDLPGGFAVEHIDCTDHPTGTITNAMTGGIVSNV